jgi:type I restriction enzyme S subunit
MARAKKETALTPEERLQAALVPDWEWPYKLPENWCWTRMQEIAQWGSGGTPSRKVSEYYNGDISWVKTGELNDDYIFETEEHITQEAISHSSAKIYPTDTVVIAMYGATIGKVGILGIPAATNQACACAIVKPSTDYKYLFYYAQSQKDDFIKKGKGGAQPNISQEIIKFHKFPLPPLAEQQRIVDRIESLFAKLDEAKEKAQAVMDSFETRKAAILHKAFTGELTAKWREEHGVRMESWEKKSVGELCISLKYGTAKKSNASGSVVVLRMGNLQQGEIDWSDLAYSNDPDDIEKYKLFPGDVLFNRTNSAALVGKTAIYRGEHPAIYAGYLIKLDYDHDKIIGDYLNYALNTLDAKKYCNSVKTDGVNQSNINAKKIGAYSFNVPSIPEQEKIVSVIQKLLSKEQQAKEAAEAVLDQIDLMKKSILARAFRGELGTNDPSEESAVELLKQLI